ncbi:carbohydrate porin [Phreatobacter oligotrophus]|uniref:High affinity Mn2+ porin n=1 Tax=Phreatobacter oligotrophus TaxID=1122261 RepID=A0A2T4YLQ9_9HYPH|nr:carbohydrate porin [Phreatobacter oligotrophus]PTM44258.1 high affinity Mn2+ porin [Phreatobacter oligotrophus]
MFAPFRHGLAASALLLGPIIALSSAVLAQGWSRPLGDQMPEDIRLNAQLTEFIQGYPSFRAAYSGQNSLPAGGQVRQTTSITAFLGVRLPWTGGEFYFNPEYFQGFGLGETLGIAGFTNGDAQKAGNRVGVLSVARAFWRQTFALGSETEWRAGDFNQIASYVPTGRVVMTVGKFAALDIFQTSSYAGDTRRQFWNWSIWSSAAWDFAADVRGYTQGVAVEIIPNPTLAIRYGALLLPSQPNGGQLPMRLNNLNHIVEIAYQHNWFGRPGVIKPFAFYSLGNMGKYTQAISISGLGVLDPDSGMAMTRRYGNRKWGYGVLLDQEIADNIGAFLRANWSDGRTETIAFTQIDRSVSFGLSFKGDLWNRPGHSAGIAVAQNDLSRFHKDFLVAGGTGVIVGDGALRYGSERLLETYYELPVFRENLFIAANYQLIHNPGYNRDRAGPVHVLGMRIHSRY